MDSAPRVLGRSASTINNEQVNTMLTLTDTQKCALSLDIRTAAGNPAQIDGAPVWAVSDPAVLEVTVDTEDPKKATVRAVGPLGVGQVTVKVDADLGEGVREITGILDVTVLAGSATVVLVASGTPEEQNPPAPTP